MPEPSKPAAKAAPGGSSQSRDNVVRLPMATYDTTARALHWLVAALVITLIGLGLVMTNVSGWTKFSLYQLHKSLGFTVLGLMAVRIIWRLNHRPPPLPGTMGKLERLGAHGAHLALYALLVIIPISGWMMVSSAAFQIPTRLFWTIPIPHIEALAKLSPAERKPYEEFFKATHEILAYAIAGLIMIHIAAALRHHFLKGDNVLRRMWLTWGKPTSRMGLLLAALGSAGMIAGLGPSWSIKALHGHLVPQALAQGRPPLWKVDPAKSTVGFTSDAAGQTITGKFARYMATIAFDPARTDLTQVNVTIEMGSATTGQTDVDGMLVDEIWFDAKKRPVAQFRSTRCEKTGPDAFMLSGELTLKGQTKPVSFPFRLALEGSRAKASGAVTIDRLDFGVGPTGAIAGMVIGKDVKITLAIEADRTQ